MLFYIAGRVSDQTILEFGTHSDFNLTDFRTAFAQRFGGVYTDYYIYSVDVSNADTVRAMKPDEEFTAVWQDGAIIGLDFTIEDTYRIMRFEPRDENGAVNDTLTANGTDYLDITASVWNPSLTEIDATFNETLQIPIINPDKKHAFIKALFNSGVSVKRFKTLEYGVWNIPCNFKFKDYHIKTTSEQVLDINALMDL